jgi:hypothetical protein
VLALPAVWSEDLTLAGAPSVRLRWSILRRAESGLLQENALFYELRVF